MPQNVIPQMVVDAFRMVANPDVGIAQPIFGMELNNVDPNFYVHKSANEKATPPEFPGWRALKRDEPFKAGDVYVCPFGYPTGRPDTPKTGSRVASAMYDHYLEMHTVTCGFHVYRPLLNEEPAQEIDPELYFINEMGKRQVAPVIPGWKALPRNKPILSTDGRFVRYPRPDSNPEAGVEIRPEHVGLPPSSIAGSQPYVVYYKSKTRTLPGNPHYAEPLPIP